MCDYSHFKLVFDVSFKPNWQQNFSFAPVWKCMIFAEPTQVCQRVLKLNKQYLVQYAFGSLLTQILTYIF